jgi:1-acyl-sn-glycerol-3-phosphate acyltransferase
MCARKVVRKKFHKKPYIVIQETNVAMPGIIGYLMNNLNTLPLRKGPNYITKEFLPELKALVDKGEFVLIYPEEEMWYNYRKPRPCKRGSYLFAAMADAPVVPVFVEIIDTGKKDNEQFNLLKFVAHVLDPIYPDPKKSAKENSREMAEKDYKQRVEAYEKAYGEKLDYKFSYKDIVGLRSKY